jgi:hypothetical protein
VYSHIGERAFSRDAWRCTCYTRARYRPTGTGFEWCKDKEGTWDLNGVWHPDLGSGRTLLDVHRNPLPEAVIGQIEAELIKLVTRTAHADALKRGEKAVDVEIRRRAVRTV